MRLGQYLKFGVSASLLAIGWEAGHSDRLGGKIGKREKRGEHWGTRSWRLGRKLRESLCHWYSCTLRCGSGSDEDPKLWSSGGRGYFMSWQPLSWASSSPACWLNQDLIFLFLCCLLAGVVYWLKLFPYGCNVEPDYIKRGAFLCHCSAVERSSLPLSPSNLLFLHKTLGLEHGTCSGIIFFPLWGCKTRKLGSRSFFVLLYLIAGVGYLGV